MTNPDFEKTQIWAKSLVNAPVSPPPPIAAAAAPAIAMPMVPKKPVLKKLTKEEKIILASGGALAIGLGAIVITSLPDDAVAMDPDVALETANLTAPILDLDSEPEIAESPEPSAPPPFRPRSAAPREPVAKQEVAPTPEPAAAGDHHSLLQIPDSPEVATGVRDEVPFIEAFNTARAEVGPAGLFAWRDTFYSTFTEKEWDLVPEDQKKHWLEGAEPIIHPGYENLQSDPAAFEPAFQHVIVAERGELTWTGIDRNGDGQVEVLMGRINGQSPMVLMDTDGDGILDTRYDFEAKSGKTFASQIEPFSMTASEIEYIEFVPIEADMGFFNTGNHENAHILLPVSIHQEVGQYVVTMDSDGNNTIDAITFLSDEKGPVVGLDFDNDGQIEMGFSYDSETHSIVTVEVEPLEEMKMGQDVIPQFSYGEDDALLNNYNYDPEADSHGLAFEDNLDDNSDPSSDGSYDDHEQSLFS